MADRGTRSGGSSGGRGPSLPAGLQSQTVKGAALVAVAVIVGIVLLQIVDPGKSGPAGARTTNTTRETTSTTRPHTTTKPTTTTTKKTPEKTPAQVKLLVLNSGAASGAAGHVSTTLHTHGYTNQGTPGNNTTKIVGTKVECLPSLTRESARLVTLLGPGTAKGTLTAPLPTGATGYDCVVLVGSG